MQVSRQRVTDLAQPLNGYSFAAKLGPAVNFLQTGTQATENSPGGHGRGITATPEHLIPSDPEAALFAHPFDVGSGGAHVFGGNITAAEGLNGSAQSAEQCLTLGSRMIANDHRFTATVIELSQCGLERHRLG